MVSTGRLNEVGLKAVFNKFDVDHSGAVDANEMASMIKMLKLDMSPARKRQMDAERAAARQKYHDDIYEWKQLSAIDA